MAVAVVCLLRTFSCPSVAIADCQSENMEVNLKLSAVQQVRVCGGGGGGGVKGRG